LPCQIAIPSDFQAAREVEQRILSEVARHGYSKSATFAIRLAVEEGLSNAIKHGNRGESRRKVNVTYDVSDERVLIVIADEGDGFDPRAVPDPTADENLENPCGRGLMLMRAYMDEVCFNERGNEVRMVKLNR